MTAMLSAPSPRPAPSRLTTTVVRGTAIAVPCPDWCVVDHASERESFLEDVTHRGPEVAVSAPVGINYRTEDILSAYVTQAPFLPDSRDRGPLLAVDATGSGEFAELSKTEAHAFLDQLAAHIAALRVEVNKMSEVTR